jgi:hypothetical protein
MERLDKELRGFNKQSIIQNAIHHSLWKVEREWHFPGDPRRNAELTDHRNGNVFDEPHGALAKDVERAPELEISNDLSVAPIQGSLEW